MFDDRTEYKSLQIIKLCPRFLRCSAPLCPLDPLQDSRDALPDEPKCGVAKSIRLRIGKNSTLPRKGLTKKEWAARERWEKLSESEKRQRTSFLRPKSANYTGISRATYSG